MRIQANSQKVGNKQNTAKLQVVTEQKVKGLKEYQTIKRPLTSREETLQKISQVIKYYPQSYLTKRIAQKIYPPKETKAQGGLKNTRKFLSPLQGRRLYVQLH